MTTLQQLVADLEYAAGEGANRLASEVVRAGRVEAEVGVHIAAAGRALVASGQAVAAQGETGASADTVAASMANQAADGGARLAVGQR